MIVLKFGGTSVGTPEKVRDAAAIVEQQPEPRAAVVSAASGVTNLLLEAAQYAAAGDTAALDHVLELITTKHTAILDGIADKHERAGAVGELDQLYAALHDALGTVTVAGEVSKELSDRIVSTGEKSMTVMLAALLRAGGTPAVHVFADTVIGTDDRFGNARPDRDRTRAQAQELAHFGAKVLHPRTIRPAVARDIPVRILSTFAPTEPGTLVQRKTSDASIKAVTAMKGLMMLSIDVPELEDLAGAAASVFQQLHVDRVEIVHVAQASSRRRMTYLVDAASAGGCATTVQALDTALDDYEAAIACDEQVALVAAVGEGAADKPATLSKMMEVLRKAGVPVLGSSQQTSNVALVVVVPALRAQKAVEVVHEAFIGKQPASASGRRPRRTRMQRESLRVG
jgi:aspartate kinase